MTEWVINPAKFWRRNSMTHIKIVTVWTMMVWFLFQKQIQIRVTILVKMTCQSVKSDKKSLNRSHFWFQTLNFCANFWNPPKNKVMTICTPNENCHTNLNLKSKSDYRCSNGDDFSELDCVYTTVWPFHWEGTGYNGPQPMALGLIWSSWCHQNPIWPGVVG